MSRWICGLNECIRLIQPNGIKAKPSSLIAMHGPLMPLRQLTGFLEEATTDTSLQNDERINRHGAVIK